MMDSALIDEYERGGQLLAKSIAGLSREELTSHPIPGKWSIQEVVIHMQDSDSIAIDRMVTSRGVRSTSIPARASS